ncbi:MAG: beta-1-3, beta-1-6-glucan biosynthesis protein, partial [Hyphomicrobiales bacterium]|nr:beta-1-3, beta-1-6-glucan biosynthesis protein [Hyphomicrobiales bacterium]
MFGFQSLVLRRLVTPAIAVLLGAGAVVAPVSTVLGQEQKAAIGGPTPAEIAREGQKRADEFVEATQVINGPAGNPECV